MTFTHSVTLVADRETAAVKFNLQRAIGKIRTNGIKSEHLGEIFMNIARWYL